MPSIRDWQAKEFSTLTDWYSFAIVACQLFIGLHPYKGRHPSYKRDIKQRALDNISIFNKEVSVPKAVRDFSNIPSEYINWFVKMFEKGERIPPPLVAGALKVKPTVTVVEGSNLITIKQLFENKDRLKSFIELPWNNEILKVRLKNGKLLITNEKNIIINNIMCSSFMIYNNIIYAKNNDKLYEITLTCFNKGVFAKNISWQISKNSSKLLDGIVYQNLLGKSFLKIPYEKGKMKDIAIPELDEYKIIDGKYESKVAIFIGLNLKTNLYDKITLIFDELHNKYAISSKEDVDYYINFTVLENGVVLEIFEDGRMSIFLNKIDKVTKKEVKDKIISTEWKLIHSGTKAKFVKNKMTFELKMK